MDLEFIQQRIDRQKEYIQELDRTMHTFKGTRYKELRDSATGVLENLWMKKQRILLEQEYGSSRGKACNASWQVDRIGGGYKIKCRNCDTILQSGCTPKCLKE